MSEFEEIKKAFMDSINMGVKRDCPCCGRYAQVYDRRIHSMIAVQLIHLFHAAIVGEWVKLDDSLRAAGIKSISDFSVARHWGLILQKSPDENDKIRSTSGYYKLTQHGARFVLGQVSIAKYAKIFDDECLGFSEERVFIKDCLGDKFSYSDLMRGK